MGIYSHQIHCRGHSPEQQLSVLLHHHPSQAEAALDALYSTALHTSGNWDRVEFATDFCAVLGVIVTAGKPLSDITIDHVLGLDGPRSSTFILSHLRCLIQWTQGQAAKPLHASFADYLTDAHWCNSQPWFIDVSIHHELLAIGLVLPRSRPTFFK
jgi:hypothetical protein